MVVVRGCYCVLKNVGNEVRALWLYNYLCLGVKKSELSRIYSKHSINCVIKFYGFKKRMRGSLSSYDYDLNDFKLLVDRNPNGIANKDLAISFLDAIADEINEESLVIKEVKEVKEIEDVDNIDTNLKFAMQDVYLATAFVILTIVFSIFIKISASLGWFLSVLYGILLSMVILVLMYKGFVKSK